MTESTPNPTDRRFAHLVGSTPFRDTAQALDIMLDKLGPALRTVPDGETGTRQNWIEGLVESFQRQTRPRAHLR